MPNAPTIIESDATIIYNELVADFQSRTGRILQQGQVETALLSSWAYREALLRGQIQNAATQNLVDFAIAPILDYLGRLVGVNRIPATFATCTLGFTLVSGHGAGSIPAGTRAGSTDGKLIFTTISNVDFAVGATTVYATGQCNVQGVEGNGYIAGTISRMLTPLPAVSSVANTTTTGAGADQESDDQLRERIILAPNAFSTAGSRQAYQFWTKTAHPTITDVAVLSDTPGIVLIYPKVSGSEETSQTIIDAVYNICSAETVRPLCDQIQVISPTRVDYSLDIDVLCFEDADKVAIFDQLTINLNELTASLSEKLGRDVIMPEKVIAACMIDGVYSVNTNAMDPVIIAATEFSHCTAITLSVNTTTNE